MESGTSRKRPWDVDGPMDLQVKRRGSHIAPLAASTSRSTSPLPNEAGYQYHDNRIDHTRRLPPLYTSSCNTLAEGNTPRSEQAPTPAHWSMLLHNPRPRSQSLFTVFRHPNWQDHERHTERPTDYIRTLESDVSPPPVATELHLPRFGTDPAPLAAPESIGCLSNCQGQECLNARNLMHKLATELTLLEQKVNLVTHTDHNASDRPHTVEPFNTAEALERVLDLVQWSNLNLQKYLDRQSLRSPSRLSQSNVPFTMRRNQHHLEEREEQSPPLRQYPNSQHGYSGPAYPSVIPEDPRRLPYHGGEMGSLGSSPYHTSSSPGSAFMPPQSPIQASQPTRSTILPSPSSLNFPNAPKLPSMSPPSTAGQTSAQSAHLQDLQHQISVKTLAFQTLQREYDSLLQKLERQRTKCATLEKKFEVSDIEINSLTDEKEKLDAQIAALECQIEDLQQSRDDARRQLAANGAQYMQIVEMANKLQGKSAEDKKKWETERSELEQRIRLLEEAMVTGTEQTSLAAENLKHSSTTSPGASSAVLSPKSVTPSASQSETINVLRAEVGRLRSRTQTLETALQNMRRDSISIQEAARQLLQSGDKIEDVARGALDG